MDELLRNEILVPLKNSEQLMHFYLNVKLRPIILLFQYLNNVFHMILMCYLPMENSNRNYSVFTGIVRFSSHLLSELI